MNDDSGNIEIKDKCIREETSEQILWDIISKDGSHLKNIKYIANKGRGIVQKISFPFWKALFPSYSFAENEFSCE